MRVANYHFGVVVVSVWVACGSLIGCGGAGLGEESLGVLSVNLVGQAPSGAIYRLRDAIVTVQGPTFATVFNTEDNPDQTSLSANVAVGDYSALLQDGWRLERVDGSTATPVTAALTSDNPSRFTVTGSAEPSFRWRSGSTTRGWISRRATTSW